MTAFELLARLRLLTLWGQDDDGELEWVGTFRQHQEVAKEEQKIINDYEFNQIWASNT